MDLFNLLYHKKNFLTDQECTSFIKEFERQKIRSHIEGSSNAIDGKRYESNFRVIDLQPTNKLYPLAISKMENVLISWVNYLETFNSFHVYQLKNNLNFPHSVRILKYSQGQYIHPHTDHEDHNYASIVLNLNEDYQGGEFCFFNRKFKLKLTRGDAIVFPADCFWVHEVLPIVSGARYSINSFIQNISTSKKVKLKDEFNNPEPKIFNLP